MTLLAAAPDKAWRAQANRIAILARDPNRGKPASIPAHAAVSNLARYKGESDDLLF